MIAKDEKIQQLLDDKGYAIIPLLTEGELDELLRIYEDAPKQHGAFTASAHIENTAIRKQLSNDIKHVIIPRVNEMLQHVDILGASFVVKSAGYNEKLQPHQDWNIVEEKNFRSYNIWIPLVNTTKENGAIMVMPESHKWEDTIRHSSIPCAFRDVYDELLQTMVTLDIPAGSALIYDHALLHASHANPTSVDRIAIAVGVKPKNAEMYLYWNNNGTIEKYGVDENYFLEKNIFNQPIGLNKKEAIIYSFPSVDQKRLTQLTGISFEQKDFEPKLSWYKVYTPMNILREIAFRLTQKNT